MFFFRYIWIVILFLPAITWGNNYLTLLNTNDYDYIVGIDLGVGYPSNLGNSAQFPVGLSTFTYEPRNNNNYPFYGGISIDKNILLINNAYLLQAGLNYSYLSTMVVNGNISQGIEPPYYQANYTYAVNSTQLFVEAKLRHMQYQMFSPYFVLALGAAFNHAKNYSTNIPAYLTVTPMFTNNNTSSFAYALGLGFDYRIGPKLSLGLIYRFINLGEMSLGGGKIRETSVSNPFKQSNLYINTLAVHLNYFI